MTEAEVEAEVEAEAPMSVDKLVQKHGRSSKAPGIHSTCCTGAECLMVVRISCPVAGLTSIMCPVWHPQASMSAT